MNASKLLLRFYGEREGDQWTVMCLDFSLAAQAETVEEAQDLLRAQIIDYLTEAIAGQDRLHGEVLLSRRAPLKYWLKFYFLRALSKMHYTLRYHMAQRNPMPLVPAAA